MKTIRLLFKFLFLLIVLAVGAYFFQDFEHYPALTQSTRLRFWTKPQISPRLIEQLWVTSADGVEVDVWRLPVGDSKSIALILHGERQTLQEAFRVQQWFQKFGYTTYSFDYRGFGKSGGWPSENGMLLDAEAVLDRIIAKEAITADKVLLVGESFGATLSARLAANRGSRQMVLMSVQRGPEARMRGSNLEPLIPLLRARFAIEEDLAALGNRCIVFIGAGRSAIGSGAITPLSDIAAGTNRVEKFISPTGRRSLDALETFREQVQQLLSNCDPTPAKPIQ